MCQLPINICYRLDRLNRNFLWGHIRDTDKKVHLIGWDDVCKPKSVGGLGIRKAKDNNVANLAKLSWQVVNNNDLLWVKVANAKYV